MPPRFSSASPAQSATSPSSRPILLPSLTPSPTLRRPTQLQTPRPTRRSPAQASIPQRPNSTASIPLSHASRRAHLVPIQPSLRPQRHLSLIGRRNVRSQPLRHEPSPITKARPIPLPSFLYLLHFLYRLHFLYLLSFRLPPPATRTSAARTSATRPVACHPSLCYSEILGSAENFAGTTLSGRSAAWLARLVRDQEVEGSNPFAPTTFPQTHPALHQLHLSHL